MKDIAWIFQIVAFIALINAVWVGFWALLAASGTWGAKMSKKVGTDNAGTDNAIHKGESMTKELLAKLGWRLGIAVIAYVIFWIWG